MRTVLVCALLLATCALAAVPSASATAFCTDLTSGSCRSLLCFPTLSGAQMCSEDLNPVCVTEPCPQPIP